MARRLLGMAALLLGTAAVSWGAWWMRQPVETLPPPLRVSWESSKDVLSTVTVRPEGEVAVGFDQGGALGVRLKVYGAMGHATGETLLGPGTSHVQWRPMPSGFLAGWHHVSGPAYLAKIGLDGALRRPVVTLFDRPTAHAKYVDMTVDSSGESVVAWSVEHRSGGYEYGLQRFGSDLEPAHPPRTVPIFQPAAGNGPPGLAMDEAGAVLVAWGEWEDEHVGLFSVMHFPDGRWGEPTRIASGRRSRPQVVAMPGLGFAVASRELFRGGTRGAYLQTLDPMGAPLEGPITLHERGGNAIVVGCGERLYASWDAEDGVWLGTYDRSLHPVEPPWRISPMRGFHERPNMTLRKLEDDKAEVILTWEGGKGVKDILARRLWVDCGGREARPLRLRRWRERRP